MSRAWRVAVGAAGVAILADCWDRLNTTSRWWVVPCVLALASVLPWCTERLAAQTPPGTVPLTIVAVAAVSYLCVPETDQMLGAAVLAALLAVVELVGRRVTPAWAQCAVALLVLWAGFYGATGRPSALVGAAFAWWPLLAGALVAAAGLVPRGSATRVARGLAVVGIGVGAAGIVARTGALADSIGPALVAVALAAPVSALAILAVILPGDRVVARL